MGCTKSKTTCKFVAQLKSNPLKNWADPQDSKSLGLPELLYIRHTSLGRLSALRAGRLYPPGNIPFIHLCQRLSRPQGHCKAEGIISIKNFSNAIGNQTRHLSACSEVSQQTSSLRTPCFIPSLSKNLLHLYKDNIQQNLTRISVMIYGLH